MKYNNFRFIETYKTMVAKVHIAFNVFSSMIAVQRVGRAKIILHRAPAEQRPVPFVLVNCIHNYYFYLCMDVAELNWSHGLFILCILITHLIDNMKSCANLQI